MSYLNTIIAFVQTVFTVMAFLQGRRKTPYKPYRLPAVVVMAVLTTISWGSVAFYYYQTNYSNIYIDNAAITDAWEVYRYNDIIGRKYAHAVVKLDGNRYTNCTFDDVTFVYDGTAPTTISTGNTLIIRGVLNFRSENPMVYQTLQVLASIRLLAPGSVLTPEARPRT